jgi:hypothetical protein
VNAWPGAPQLKHLDTISRIGLVNVNTVNAK